MSQGLKANKDAVDAALPENSNEVNGLVKDENGRTIAKVVDGVVEVL